MIIPHQIKIEKKSKLFRKKVKLTPLMKHWWCVVTLSIDYKMTDL